MIAASADSLLTRAMTLACVLLSPRRMHTQHGEEVVLKEAVKGSESQAHALDLAVKAFETIVH